MASGTSSLTAVKHSWEAEYARRRYQAEPPVEFVWDIVRVARDHGTAGLGLYIGCGNGRNFLPLSTLGLDLIGLDVAPAAIAQLKERAPDVARRLLVGEINSVRDEAVFATVIGIQVFQHGTRDQAHQHIRAAARRVARGGLLCIRVNACSTEIELDHERIDEADDGSFTVAYKAGPKAGLAVHFFAAPELDVVVGGDFRAVSPLARKVHWREAPANGHWDQWEGIWRKAA